jgi:hypothetical protein
MTIINKCQFGKIIIDNREYCSDVIIFPDKIHNNWWRKSGHSLIINDLKLVINYKPEVLIIGTGIFGLMHVDNITLAKIKEYGIENIIIMKTKPACKKYNQVQSIKKVAALHITC